MQDLEDYRSKMEVKSKVQRAQWMPKAPDGTTQKVNGMPTVDSTAFTVSRFVVCIRRLVAVGHEHPGHAARENSIAMFVLYLVHLYQNPNIPSKVTKR